AASGLGRETTLHRRARLGRPPVRRPRPAAGAGAVQAVSVGVARARTLRRAPARAGRAPDRAGVEDAALEHGAAGGPLGAQLRSSQPLAGVLQREALRRRIREETAAGARRS